MDVTRLRQAHDEFLAVAEAGGFGPPPAGEWDAGRILAHVALGEASGAAAALAIAAGQRAVYDNRPSLDEWNLRRMVRQASGAPLRSLLAGFGEVHLPAHAEQLRGLRR
jgi:hypothetical protein